MLYQLSYEATHWERGQLIDFIFPVRSKMMWSVCPRSHRSGTWSRRSRVWIPLKPWFLRLLLSNCLNWKLNCARWSFFTFINNRSSNVNYFKYTSHHFTPHGRYELDKLTSLIMCDFIAQLVEHRTGIAEYLYSKASCHLLRCGKQSQAERSYKSNRLLQLH